MYKANIENWLGLRCNFVFGKSVVSLKWLFKNEIQVGFFELAKSTFEEICGEDLCGVVYLDYSDILMDKVWIISSSKHMLIWKMLCRIRV